MLKYKNIIAALGICHAEFDYSFDQYKSKFRDAMKADSSFAKSVKEEVLIAQKDDTWSWKAAAKEAGFCYFDENENEAFHLDEIKAVIWDILFPDE